MPAFKLTNVSAIPIDYQKMARSEEVSDAPAAPVDNAPQSLVGDSMVNQDDSNLARTASIGNTDNAVAMLDPKGNEFQIDGLNEDQERNLQNQQVEASLAGVDKPNEGDKPAGGRGIEGNPRDQISPGDSIAINSEDGLKKNLVTGNEQSTMQFSADGKLQSFTTRSDDGFTTTTNFDETGRATSRSVTNPSGVRQDVDVLRGTRVSDTPTADGGRDISITERGKTNSFTLDNAGNIREASTLQGLSLNTKTFDAKGNIETDFSRRTVDGVTNSTFTRPGFREITTTNENTGETDITRVNQHEPYTNRINPSVQRTDNIHINYDGSSDANTTYKNEPGVTYKTHTGSDGRYQTDKVNDTTGERWPYRHGTQVRRV